MYSTYRDTFTWETHINCFSIDICCMSFVTKMFIVVYNLWIVECRRHLATFRLSSTHLVDIRLYSTTELVSEWVRTYNIYWYCYVFRFRSLTHKQCGPVNLHDRLAVLCRVLLRHHIECVYRISFTTIIMFHKICNTCATVRVRSGVNAKLQNRTNNEHSATTMLVTNMLKHTHTLTNYNMNALLCKLTFAEMGKGDTSNWNLSSSFTSPLCASGCRCSQLVRTSKWHRIETTNTHLSIHRKLLTVHTLIWLEYNQFWLL